MGFRPPFNFRTVLPILRTFLQPYLYSWVFYSFSQKHVTVIRRTCPVPLSRSVSV